MWRRRPKKCHAVKNWHAAAMLVDPKRTRIIFSSEVKNELESIYENAEGEKTLMPGSRETVDALAFNGGM